MVSGAPRGPATFLNAARRERALAALGDGEAADVLVVGGGATGAGVALDAASRGLSVALLERRDLANGTSRFSSKLAHGGLRYLTRLGFGLAWECAREREILADRTAPHLVRALPQLTPVYGRFPPPAAAGRELGFRLGDVMRALAGTSRRRLPSARRISAAEARVWAPALAEQQLRGAILSWDGQLEDDARLVVALARTAAAHGALICTYCEALELHAGGARALDVLTGEHLEVRARHVVNATGVWAGTLVPGLRLRPSRGAHVLVEPATVGHPRAAVNVQVPGHFGRYCFMIPRPDGYVLVGVTDTPHEDPAIADEPPVQPADERFLLETVSLALAQPLSAQAVIGRFAGLRPLLGDGAGAERPGETADLSRRHAVLEDRSSGVITVVGGKLTTYRRMAQDAVDLLVARRGVRAGACVTDRLRLVGAPEPGAARPRGVSERLWRRFGTEAAELAALAADRPELLAPLAPGVPALGVELLAAIEREGALCAQDALDRRLRLDLVPAWREAARPALEHLAGELPQHGRAHAAA
jgi:glycerol-3-phosphate dehydrogenase